MLRCLLTSCMWQERHCHKSEGNKTCYWKLLTCGKALICLIRKKVDSQCRVYCPLGISPNHSFSSISISDMAKGCATHYILQAPEHTMQVDRW